MGHARMVTNGSAESHENNQPVILDGIVCIHNGIIVNDEQLWAAHPDLQRKYEVDTEVLSGADPALPQAGAYLLWTLS